MARTATRTKLRPEDTLSKEEAARYAGVTTRTISRWLSDEDVPLRRYVRQVNRVAVSKRELDALISARVQT